MTSSRRLQVVVADDSRTARALLASILDSDSGIEVVGQAADGAEALALVKRLRPSIVLMDIDMPVMDGFEATKRIMVEAPTPIVVISARDDVRDVEVGLQAVRAGALTVIPKPAGPGTPEHARDARRIVTLVKALAEVKVVRQRQVRPVPDPPPRKEPSTRPLLGIVGVAASTGGPAALYRFLEVLPRNLDLPVLVVQHIAKGFVGGLAQWLSSAAVLPVCVAEDGAELAGCQVYIAPDDRHLEVRNGRIHLSSDSPDRGFRPSANMLFRSIADGYGATAAAVVLTGMGHDGLQGATYLREAGGLVLAQDADSSVVFGMPRVVADAGIADVVGNVENLASRIVRFAPTKGS